MRTTLLSAVNGAAIGLAVNDWRIAVGLTVVAGVFLGVLFAIHAALIDLKGRDR